MAGRDDKKVKAILGEETWHILRRSVKNGEVDAKKMRDIAYKLHEEVGGGHLRRMGPGMKKEPDWFEFREILGQWYQLELCEYEGDREAALQRLLTVFESDEVKLMDLSRNIRRTLGGIQKLNEN